MVFGAFACAACTPVLCVVCAGDKRNSCMREITGRYRYSSACMMRLMFPTSITHASSTGSVAHDGMTVLALVCRLSIIRQK